jgi:hypothetical protein
VAVEKLIKKPEFPQKLLIVLHIHTVVTYTCTYLSLNGYFLQLGIVKSDLNSRKIYFPFPMWMHFLIKFYGHASIFYNYEF